ncbi:MAG: hypothetical protein ACM3NW_08280 [Syntrophomonadaceae bacterium]
MVIERAVMIARVPALLAVALVATRASAPGQAPAGDRVALDAVWSPPEGFVAALHRECDGAPGSFGACFVAAMRRAGASDAAVAFARRTGEQGYLKTFRTTGGPVDLAFAEYPFRANENALCFLVNGAPPMLDVDDPRYLDREALRRNPAYAGLLRSYPDLAVFPGPRSDAEGIVVTLLPEGGEIVRVAYALVDGCHACARVGVLRLDFDFDASGRFAGTRVASVRAGVR